MASGAGYPHAPPLTRGMFDATWVTSVTLAVAARLGDEVVGAYYLKPNFPGRAAHIANAGYVVAAAHRRRGIGRLLVEDSIWRAPAPRVRRHPVQPGLRRQSGPVPLRGTGLAGDRPPPRRRRRRGRHHLLAACRLTGPTVGAGFRPRRADAGASSA